MRPKNLLPASILLPFALLCCSAPDQPVGTDTSPVVATFGDAAITLENVDRHVLALPPQKRPMPGSDLDAWFRRQIEEIAVEGALREHAVTEELDQRPGFVAALHENRHRIGVQACLAERFPDLDRVSEDELRSAYDEQPQAHVIPAARLTHQIYLRRRPGTPPPEQRLDEIRSRVLGGESFQRLAAELSDSESRHREGFIGWVRRGQLPAPFEREIFSLTAGVPGEPVSTRDGAHLFYVDQVQEEREVPFEEVRRDLHERLLAERRSEALESFQEEMGEETAIEVIDRESLGTALSEDTTDRVALGAPDLELTVGQLVERVPPATGRGAGTSPAGVERIWAFLQDLARLERIHHHCLDQALILEEDVREQTARWKERALLTLARRDRLADLARRDRDSLQLFYENNIGDFSRPPTWTLRRLRVPLESNASEVMEKLEQGVRLGLELEELQTRLGGDVEHLGSGPLRRWLHLEPKLPELLAPAAPGELLPPYRTADSLDLVEVEERTEPEPIPLPEIEERVAAAYVNQYTADLYDRLRTEILASGPLKVHEEVFEELLRTGLPALDVSVEQLEGLLERL